MLRGKRGKKISTLNSDRTQHDLGTPINIQEDPGCGKSRLIQLGEIPAAKETRSL